MSGIYADHVAKKSTAQASNTGAVTNVIGNVAMVLAGGAMAGLGGGMAKAGLAQGTAQGAQKAVLGNQVQKMGFQLIGRQIGGFSGIVIGSNMADAWQGKQQGTALQELMESVRTDKTLAKAEATQEAKMEINKQYMPRDLLTARERQIVERREARLKQGEKK